MSKLLTVNVVAGCVLERDGKFLLVQEKQPEVYGLWNLPAGKVDEGETLAQAAAREVLEESGFVVEVGELLCLEHQRAEAPVIHAYKGTITGGDLRFDPDEILDAKWFGIEEIRTLHQEGKLRNDWVLRSIEKYSA